MSVARLSLISTRTALINVLLFLRTTARANGILNRSKENHNKISYLRVERVRFQFPSLRQSFRDQNSLLACEHVWKPNNHGPRENTFALRPTGQDREILSLRPFVSKPPHFADSVRFS